ncbi:MAG: bifunctional phosphopantothenoylcysteine decarboxylase/phosphopantothenate--cysteine ligase CoaBC [Candidatus Thalassarchaeaceae archaeon]|nr:bifunctional phosphopantothenoylcysteine decarboxylase/phosphopantothenate--cysteine ligase CoaBC [Candidatus Thalassarchaeaceae archaeon]MDP7312968.1 bifunctional phosphopantothenoylcysteine decarboxylase/phosphopantothenate--cysteine ligase CoaBC [Candidatus Thalassarchaeaceae archaeon]
MSNTNDVDVELASNSLEGKKILVGISGGIAVVDSVRLLRELRRHGAEPIVIMTQTSQEIISPLAIEWASQTPIITDWDYNMAQLGEVDGVLVCPATRYTIASHIHGIMDSPLQMALSASRGRGVPIMFVPSMHGSLSSDPITDDLCTELIDAGHHMLWGASEEGRRKQPDVGNIVAEFSHILNSQLEDRASVLVTLGATRSGIDSVRWVQNTSSGKTGWLVSDYLYRMGHKVKVVHGETKSPPPPFLKDNIYLSNPEEMLESLLTIAKSQNAPDSWIHCAAVLDYVTTEVSNEKVKSGNDNWSINLVPSKKHIEELRTFCKGAKRIGFKLESNFDDAQLLASASEMLYKYQLDGVVANHLESLKEITPRAFWVDKKGGVTPLLDNLALAMIIENQIRRT